VEESPQVAGRYKPPRRKWESDRAAARSPLSTSDFNLLVLIGCYSESVWRCHFSSPGRTNASERNGSGTETRVANGRVVGIPAELEFSRT